VEAKSIKLPSEPKTEEYKAFAEKILSLPFDEFVVEMNKIGMEQLATKEQCQAAEEVIEELCKDETSYQGRREQGSYLSNMLRLIDSVLGQSVTNVDDKPVVDVVEGKISILGHSIVSYTEE
jgi:hypothetical protein